MTQTRLGFKRAKTIKSQTKDYDRRNLESAKLIVADPGQFGGPDSGLSQWARAVIDRIEGRTTSW